MRRSGSLKFAGLFLLAILGTGCEEQRSQIDSALFDPANEDEIEDATGAIPDLDDLDGLEKPLDELGEDPLRVRVIKNQFADSQLIITLDGEVDTRLGTLVERLEWQQLQGPTAAIMEPGNASTRVALPRVTRREVLHFRLSAVAADGYVDSAVARVTVLPLDNSIELINASFLEADEQIVFEIQLADPADEEWQLEYSTADGTALAGQDYEAASGVVVFAPDEQRKAIPVNLLEGAVRNETGYFYLQLTSLNSDRPFATQAVGLIESDPASESPSTSSFTFDGSCRQTQQQRGALTGVVRFSLQWGNPATGLGLVVGDPCANTLDRERPAVECQSTGGMWFASENEDGLGEEVIWDNGAPEGTYRVSLTHLSGPSGDFDLCIYQGDESQMYTGTLGNAETLTITEFDFAGAAPGLPGASGSSSSSSGSGSSSSSSTSSSSGSTSSSASSSSSSTSSTSSSTSASSSTSGSSGSGSSSTSSSGAASGSTSSSGSSTSTSSASSSTTSGGTGSSTSSTSSSSGSGSSSSGSSDERPDLVATLRPSADSGWDANGNYSIPIEVTVTNRGGSAAAVFKTSTEHTDPQYGWLMTPFQVDGRTPYYPQTTEPLEPGQSVTFIGAVFLEQEMAGETVELSVVADSCNGDGSSIAESYCRINESDESNNRSAPMRVVVPPLPATVQNEMIAF